MFVTALGDYTVGVCFLIFCPPPTCDYRESRYRLFSKGVNDMSNVRNMMRENGAIDMRLSQSVVVPLEYKRCDLLR